MKEKKKQRLAECEAKKMGRKTERYGETDREGRGNKRKDSMKGT